jgi:predicted phage terminase large subunit-like protein
LNNSKLFNKLSEQQFQKLLKIPINEIDKELAERSLKEFAIQAWPIVEPARPFISGWHIDAIIDHLEAVTKGDIKRLLINMPPKHMKSYLVSVLWLPWHWIKIPTERWMFCSYSDNLCNRDSMKTRRIIQSKWYQRFWGDRYKLLGDQNTKSLYENDKTGRRLATTVQGMATGDGGNIIGIDDPHNVLKTLSTAEREKVISWWNDSMQSRLDTPEGAFVVVMQRIHEGDLSGDILAKNLGYDHLCLPAEYEGLNRIVSSLGWTDPRKEPNELLWPENWNRERLDDLKKNMTPYAVAGQLQQRPVPQEGGMIQWNWFKRYTDLPGKDIYLETIQVWDTAQKANELLNCPWVCGTWMVFYDGYYLVDILRKWMNYPDGKKEVFLQAERYKPNTIIIEDKSTGQSLIQEMPTYEYNGKKFHYSIIPFEPEGDKETRMYVEAPQIHAGKVLLPIDAPWMGNFEPEVKSFPNSNFKDQIDMLSMFLKYMRVRMEMIGSRPMAWTNKPVEDDDINAPIEQINVPIGPNTRDSARMDF